jgi:glutathione synthase/RimK-type ligase-like ATP-grasp enzyme
VTSQPIAVACSREELGCAEDRFVLDAFARLNIDARHAVWDDPSVQWGAFSAVVVRHTWDYYRGKREPFCEWALRVGAETRLFNSAETIWRNTHKLYLKQLEDRGVPMIPTLFARHGEPRVDLRELAREMGWTSGVIKPAIGGAAWGLRLFSMDDIDEAEQHLANLMADGDVLVQPLVPSIRTKGETSLMFVDREFTHAVRKVPAGDDVRCQDDHGGAVFPHEPGQRELEIARRCNDAWIAETGEVPLYARVDLIDIEEQGDPSMRDEAARVTLLDPRVVEYEVVEPEMFWRFDPKAAEALARATLRRIG